MLHRYKDGFCHLHRNTAAESPAPAAVGVVVVKHKRNAQANREQLEQLLVAAGNEICADCQGPTQAWCASSARARLLSRRRLTALHVFGHRASVDHGVFLCGMCAIAHRSLGNHVSNVLNVESDDW
jgi:hypothetical protein